MTDPTFTQSTRPATESELAELTRRHLGSNPMLWVWTAFVAVLLGLCFGCVVALGASLFWGEEGQTVATWAIPVSIAVTCVLLFRSVTRAADRRSANAKADLAVAEVTSLKASGVRWHAMIDAHRMTNTLIGDLGNGQRLVLGNLWKLHWPLYATEEDVKTAFERADEATVIPEQSNGLPAPYGFPTADFEIDYFEHSGLPTAIRPSGQPEEPVDVRIQSLQQMGWTGKEVAVLEGDPGMTPLNGEAVSLSAAE